MKNSAHASRPKTLSAAGKFFRRVSRPYTARHADREIEASEHRARCRKQPVHESPCVSDPMRDLYFPTTVRPNRAGNPALRLECSHIYELLNPAFAG